MFIQQPLRSKKTRSQEGAQVDAKLEASKAEAEAVANAIQEAYTQAAAQRVEDPPTSSEKSKSRIKVRDGPSPSKYPMADAPIREV